MLGAEGLLGNGPRAAEKRLGSVVVAFGPQQSREIVEACASLRMLGALGAFIDAERQPSELLGKILVTAGIGQEARKPRREVSRLLRLLVWRPRLPGTLIVGLYVGVCLSFQMQPVGQELLIRPVGVDRLEHLATGERLLEPIPLPGLPPLIRNLLG